MNIPHAQHNLRSSSQFGFTLIELMVVVVIISVMAGIVSLSVSSIQNRKAAQQYDQLIDNLKLIRLQSLDQQQVLGLQTVDASATQPYSYQIVVLRQTDKSSNTPSKLGLATNTAKSQSQVNISASSTDAITTKSTVPSASWQPTGLMSTTLPDNMRIEISPLEQNTGITNPNFLEQNTPKLVWYGNGEVSPAKLTLYRGQKSMYEPIFVDMFGRVSTDTTKANL